MSLVKNLTHEIKESKVQILSQEQNMFYNTHNQCCLCKHQLTVEVQLKSNTNVLKEKVHCPKCNVTISTSEHALN